MRRAHRFILVAAAAAGLLAGGPALVSPAAAAGPGLPGRVFAPFYETYLAPHTPGVMATAQASGARYLTLAFLQAASKTSCTIEWNGNSSQPLGYYAPDVAALQAAGGTVIPSFGGYSADNRGTEIADSCRSVAAIAKVYESVVTAYHVSRLDMDVESKALTDPASIARRSKAMAIAQRWARRHGVNLQIQLTLGVEPNGLDRRNLAVVRSAVAHGVTISSVNLMAFDYYLGREKARLAMGRLAIEALSSAHRQLARLFPRLSPARVWRMEGVTLLPGIDDYPRKTEVTYPSGAAEVLAFARARGLNFLSIWAIQRDNGRCPGTVDSNLCSGIKQRRWAFSNLLEPYSS